MSRPERYDAIVLGSGNGGMYLSWHLARSGQHTAVVERRWIGGACPNTNCLPSKNEIWSAKVVHLMRHGPSYGAMIGTVATSMPAVRQRKREMVEELRAIHTQLYKDAGVELILGSGRFVAPRTLEVRLRDGGTRVVEAEKVFLNVGTHAAVPNVPGLEAAMPLTNIEALDLEYAPLHLIVLGGGFVGLEAAQAYRRFGSRVTILHRGPQIAGREDPDVADELRRILTGEGIDIVVAAETRRVEGRSGKGVNLLVHTPAGEQTIAGSDILAATGRVPNTAGAGLDVAGVELDPRGYIEVNDRLETTAPGVWAIGECAGSPHFTHVSFDDFRVIRDNLAGGNRTTRDRLIPYCVFTDPPLGRVGLTEGEARNQGIETRVVKMPTSAVLRTQTTGEKQGFLKALIGARDDRILGFTMIGADASEVIAVVQMTMLAGLPYTALRDAILAHPTMAEGLNVLFARVPARAGAQ